MKQKQTAWFRKVRGSYLPCSWQGWAIYVPFCLFLITVFQASIRSTHSVSGAFYSIFPQWVAAAVVMTWLAKRKA